MVPSELTPQEKRQRVSAAGLAASLALFALVVFAFSRAEHRVAPGEARNAAAARQTAPAANPAGKKALEPAAAARLAELPAHSGGAKVEIIERQPEPPPAAKPEKTPAPERAAAPAPKPAAAKPAAQPRAKPAASKSPNVPSYAPTVTPKRAKTPDKFAVIEQPPPPAPGQNSPAWYSVRLSSSTNKNLSDAVSTALRQRGFAGSETKTAPDGTYYVKVGDFSFRYAAEETKKQLQELGFTDAHIDEKTVAK